MQCEAHLNFPEFAIEAVRLDLFDGLPEYVELIRLDWSHRRKWPLDGGQRALGQPDRRTVNAAQLPVEQVRRETAMDRPLPFTSQPPPSIPPECLPFPGLTPKNFPAF